MKTIVNFNVENILSGDALALYTIARKTAEQRVQAQIEEDRKMTQKLLAEIEEIEAMMEAKETAVQAVQQETTVEVLLDTVVYDEKPQGRKISGITNRLPQSVETVTLKELAQATACGRSWKAAVLSGTTNDTFVASSLVALDIDNKESYTTIDKFLTIDSKYKPCIIYETFSSTRLNQRYRVVFAFDSIINDYSTMVALYNEVKAQYPGVDIDPSVDPGKILFGGKTLSYFKDVVNETPSLKSENFENKKTQTVANTAHINAVLEENIEIDEITVLMNLSDVAYKYADIQEVDINESYEWINKNVKMTDVLGINENTRFRCILPDHEDNNPSARIATCGDEQVYFCSCEANGYRLITLLSKVLDMSEVKVKTLILNGINVSYGSEYQKATERYIADLRRNLTHVMTQELKDYLNKRKLYKTYKLVIDFADAHITYNSFANDDRVVFFIGKRYLQETMKQENISGDAGRKLTALCELGLLRKLTDSELRSDVLNNANKARRELQRKLSHNTDSSITELNRVDFYELVDLSPSVVTKAMKIVKDMKDNAVRQRKNNVNRRINAFGAEEVTQNINVQSTVNTKKHNKTKTKLESVINDIFESNKYFNEDDLKEAYYATDKKHLTKAKAQQTVLDFIPAFIADGTLKRVRVNKESRKQYNIAAKYKSNTFVYIAA